MFPAIVAPRNGAWLQLQQTGDSVGYAATRNAGPAEQVVIEHLRAELVPRQDQVPAVELPRLSIVLPWNVSLTKPVGSRWR